MFEAAQYQHGAMHRSRLALNALERAQKAVGEGKVTLLARTAEAFVAIAVTDAGASAKSISRTFGERVKTEGTAKATLASYRSALIWRLTSETLAKLRADIAEPGGMAISDFEAACAKAAEGLGDVWADYKARKKEEKATEKEAQKPSMEAGVSSPAPERDPVLEAEQEARGAIATLIEAGATEALGRLMALMANAEAVRKSA